MRCSRRDGLSRLVFAERSGLPRAAPSPPRSGKATIASATATAARLGRGTLQLVHLAQQGALFCEERAPERAARAVFLTPDLPVDVLVRPWRAAVPSAGQSPGTSDPWRQLPRHQYGALDSAHVQVVDNSAGVGGESAGGKLTGAVSRPVAATA